MLIVHVHVNVKPESIEAFSASNCRKCTAECQRGIARFDVLQDSSEPSRFLLVEVYRNSEAPVQHKETTHYQTWRDAVASMMAEPRTSLKYNNIFPSDESWY
jgi:autoinducer 2-degrading protein